MKWLLFYVLLAGPAQVPTSGTREFDDPVACRQMVETLSRTYPNTYGEPVGFCTPASQPAAVCTYDRIGTKTCSQPDMPSVVFPSLDVRR